jgi:hypothetical protein
MYLTSIVNWMLLKVNNLMRSDSLKEQVERYKATSSESHVSLHVCMSVI